MFILKSIRILILSIWWLKRYLNMLFKLLLLFYIYPSSWLDKSLLEKEALQKLLSRSRTHPGNSGKIGMWYDMERVKKTESKVDLCLDPPNPPIPFTLHWNKQTCIWIVPVPHRVTWVQADTQLMFPVRVMKFDHLYRDPWSGLLPSSVRNEPSFTSQRVIGGY